MRDKEGILFQCSRCRKHGLWFERNYSPAEFFEGDLSSNVWIVGINPAGELGQQDPRQRSALIAYFDDSNEVHSYFKDFSRVSQKLYDGFGKPGKVGHTDIVKCYSKRFPPDGKSITGKEIVTNCSSYFNEQIMKHTPKMIICNGVAACREIEQVVPKQSDEDHQTHYFGKINGERIVVVLSGFIGRIDNFARRRLGKEIEQLLSELNCAI